MTRAPLSQPLFATEATLPRRPAPPLLRPHFRLRRQLRLLTRTQRAAMLHRRPRASYSFISTVETTTSSNASSLKTSRAAVEHSTHSTCAAMDVRCARVSAWVSFQTSASTMKTFPRLSTSSARTTPICRLSLWDTRRADSWQPCGQTVTRAPSMA